MYKVVIGANSLLTVYHTCDWFSFALYYSGRSFVYTTVGSPVPDCAAPYSTVQNDLLC